MAKVPQIPFIDPSGGTHTKHQGSKDPSAISRMTNAISLKPLGGVRGILQGLKKFQVDMAAFVWLPWQLLNHPVLFALRWRNGTKNSQFSNAFKIYNYPA